MAKGIGVDLFSKLVIGPFELKHRVVAPLTRMRALQPGNVPGDLSALYYGQRASEGGLIVTEATQVSPQGQP
jgi:N-ethylmaleimide reductase